MYPDYYKAALQIMARIESDADHFKAILEIDPDWIQACPVGRHGPQCYASEGSTEWNASLADAIKTFKDNVGGFSTLDVRLDGNNETQSQLNSVERKFPLLDEEKLSDIVQSYQYMLNARRVLDGIYSEAKELS